MSFLGAVRLGPGLRLIYRQEWTGAGVSGLSRCERGGPKSYALFFSS